MKLNMRAMVFALIAVAQTASAEGPSLTVYSSADPAGFDPQRFIAQASAGYNPQYVWQVPGFGVIRDTREFELKAGSNQVLLSDVAQFIDPSTVSFVNLSRPAATHLLEQSFRFDLANADKILDRYIDHDISVSVAEGDRSALVSGKLVSHTGGSLVVSTARGIEVLQANSPRISLGELPGGLISRPTLALKLNADSAGKYKFRTTYQTDGISWRSDYNLVLNQSEDKADIGAWVTLLNLTGSSYHDAALKLIAGDVQRVEAAPQYQALSAKRDMMLAAAAPEETFQEKSFFEYHMYTLPRRTDILSNSTQQIALFPTASEVNVKKVLVYYGQSDLAGWGFAPEPRLDRSLGTNFNTKVDIYVRFKNEEKNHLGIPLPKGKVRVFKADPADGSLEFIGEDLLDHTPRDEEVLVKLGQSFDIVGERKQTNFSIDLAAKTISESFKIDLKNHKDAEQELLVRENLYRWSNWNVVEKSDAFEKIDARTIHFKIKVPARGSKSVSYTVKYTW